MAGGGGTVRALPLRLAAALPAAHPCLGSQHCQELAASPGPSHTHATPRQHEGGGKPDPKGRKGKGGKGKGKDGKPRHGPYYGAGPVSA